MFTLLCFRLRLSYLFFLEKFDQLSHIRRAHKRAHFRVEASIPIRVRRQAHYEPTRKTRWWQTLRKRTRKIPLAQHAARYYAHVTLYAAYVVRAAPLLLQQYRLIARQGVTNFHFAAASSRDVAEVASGTRTAGTAPRGRSRMTLSRFLW